MDWDTAQRIFRIGMVISFLVAALGIVGELLGWWNDTGEVLATVGSLAGILLGTVSILANASQSQVAEVASGVQHATEALDETNGKLDKLEKLDKLDTIEGKLHTLDDIDEDLGQQVDLLTQIRDRL